VKSIHSSGLTGGSAQYADPGGGGANRSTWLVDIFGDRLDGDCIFFSILGVRFFGDDDLARSVFPILPVLDTHLPVVGFLILSGEHGIQECNTKNLNIKK
jgi:hypothetical protein